MPLFLAVNKICLSCMSCSFYLKPLVVPIYPMEAFLLVSKCLPCLLIVEAFILDSNPNFIN